MQITKEQFDQVKLWLGITIPADKWPNPRSRKQERTFFISKEPYTGTFHEAKRHILTANEFSRLARG